MANTEGCEITKEKEGRVRLRLMRKKVRGLGCQSVFETILSSSEIGRAHV